MGMRDYYSNEPTLSHIMGERVPNSTKRDKSWNNGQLAFGEILKVHQKRYTADVKIIKTQDEFVSPDDQEGQYACKIGVSSAGFNTTYQMPYGEILPIHTGDIVLVGFLGNSTEQPVILKVFHDISENVGDANYRNILPNTDASKDIEDYLKITPIQDYVKITENGDFERVSHTKSFIIGTEDEIDPETFDFEDLTVKFPTDKTIINPNAHMDTKYDVNPTLQSGDTSGETKTIHVKENYSKPKTYLAVFRDKFNDAVTNWLRFIVNAATTSFRILQSKRNFSGSSNGASTSISLNSEGTVTIVRQLDTRFSNSEFESGASKQYSEIVMDKNGAITVQTVDKSGSNSSNDYPRTMVHLYPKGGMLSLYTTSKLTINAKNGITMTSDENIAISSKKAVSITSKQGTQITSEQNVRVSAQADTIITATSAVTTQAPSVKTSGSQERYGSDKSVGGSTHIGNIKSMGGISANGRTVVTDGDPDTEGDSTLAMGGNSVIEAVKTFVINKAMDMATNELMKNTPGASAIAGLVQMGSGLYQNFQGMEFNDFATKESEVAIGTIIAENSPFFGQFSEFATFSGVDVNSISGQMEFLAAPTSEGGLGLDILTGAPELGDFESTMKQASALWNAFGSLNVIETQVDKCFSTSSEVELSSSEKSSVLNACKLVTCEIQPTEYNRDIGEGSSFNLSDMVKISTLTKEGDTKKIVKNNNDGTSSTSTHELSIEDALNAVAKYAYPNGNWKDEVKKIEEQIDRENGTNSLQYCDKNRKETYGNVMNQSTRPSPITNKNQYYDRIAKRYVYNNAIKVIDLANSSWKSYESNRNLQTAGMSFEQIVQQQQNWNQYHNS